MGVGLLNLYVNPHDPESLGIRILDILQAPYLRPDFSKAGPQKVRSLFSWQAVAQHFLTSVSLATAERESVTCSNVTCCETSN